MGTTLDAVTADAMKLSPAERAELLERIADSMLPAAPLHPAWDAELARRLADMDAAVGDAVPAQQVLAELHALIRPAAARKA